MLPRAVGPEQVAAVRHAALCALPAGALLGVAEELLLGQNQRRPDPERALVLARAVVDKEPGNGDANWLVSFLEVLHVAKEMV